MEIIGNDIAVAFGKLPLFARYSINGVGGCLLFLFAAYVGEKLGKSLYYIAN